MHMLIASYTLTLDHAHLLTGMTGWRRLSWMDKLATLDCPVTVRCGGLTIGIGRGTCC